MSEDTRLSTQEWNDEQKALLKQTVAEGTTDVEFSLFAQVCRRTGLDPFTRQIYAIKRWQNGKQRMVIQTSIDGYRAIADRTGEYAGGGRSQFGPPCDCGLAKTTPHPRWAVTPVRRIKDGVAYETETEATFDEYVATDRDGSMSTMWRKMPRTMIQKCSEAVSLRRAFPGRFEGIYTDAEMEQAGNHGNGQVIDSPVAPAPPPVAPRVIDVTMPPNPTHPSVDGLNMALMSMDPKVRAAIFPVIEYNSAMTVKAWLESLDAAHLLRVAAAVNGAPNPTTAPPSAAPRQPVTAEPSEGTRRGPQRVPLLNDGGEHRACPVCTVGNVEMLTWPNGDQNLACSEWRDGCKYRDAVPAEVPA